MNKQNSFEIINSEKQKNNDSNIIKQSDKIDKNQALNFLTEDSYHLRMICELAGRDADYVRGKIRAKLLDE